jgi:hypothetical protein
MRDRYNLNNLPFGAAEDMFDGWLSVLVLENFKMHFTLSVDGFSLLMQSPSRFSNKKI